MGTSTLESSFFRASALEYRYRWGLHAVLYGLGFWAPWTFYTAALGSRETLWNVGMGELARTRLLSFDAAAVLLLCLGLLFVALGALLRVWGSAYVGSSVVHSKAMHGDALLADGIYRHTRNPLYLGTLLHTFGGSAGDAAKRGSLLRRADLGVSDQAGAGGRAVPYCQVW